jgi:hypothetical protein
MGMQDGNREYADYVIVYRLAMQGWRCLAVCRATKDQAIAKAVELANEECIYEVSLCLAIGHVESPYRGMPAEFVEAKTCCKG